MKSGIQSLSKLLKSRKALPVARNDKPESLQEAPISAERIYERPYTAALIVHWGDPDPTVRLVRELGKRNGIDEVIVIANDLHPRPQELAESAAWIVPPRNLGFAGGFDYGCRASQGVDCYLLLNNDVVIDEECITECQQVLGDPSIGVVAPVLVNDEGFQSAVGSVSYPLFKATSHNCPSTDRVCDAPFVTGAVMFIRAECYAKVGFNLSYFLGWEDADFCFRARTGGWRVVVACHAQAWHRGKATIPTAGSTYFFARNRIWFSRRWGTPLDACIAWAWIASVLTPRVILRNCIKRRGFKPTLSLVHALIDGLKKLPADDYVPIGEPYPAKWSHWS